MALDFVSTVRPYLWFGSYPSQERIDILEESGVRLFVNLTHSSENLPPYTTNYMYMNIPIEDNSIPSKVSLFCLQMMELKRALLSGSIAYVHCKGGHGRSGMVSAILLSLIEMISPRDAINEVTLAHRARPNLRDFWKKRPCPHIHEQRKFIYTLFTPYYMTIHDYNMILENILDTGFSQFLCKCKIPILGSRKPLECSKGCINESICSQLNVTKLSMFSQI